MSYLKRSEIKIDNYQEIFKKESHHSHNIVMIDGVIRWKKNLLVGMMADKIGLNDLVIILYEKGYDKNSEVYRQLYRDIGYSLSGYWEIFYWEMNNEACDEYNFKEKAEEGVNGGLC